jgi:hypothetical protein
MVDFCDTTDATIELVVSKELAAIRSRIAVREYEPTGICHNPNCEDVVAPGKIFCNETCARECNRLRNLGH